jgi:hypothetical protein
MSRDQQARRLFAVAHLAAICLVIAAVLWWFFTRPTPYMPFGSFPSPQKIIAKKPFYHPGDTVYIKATKCYRAHQTVAYSGVSWWSRDRPYHIRLEKASGFGVVNPADLTGGCVTKVFGNQLPDVMPSGSWHLEGQESARRGREQVSVGWFSEQFNVKQGK